MISFRPLQRADYPLMQAWLAAPHVARWWNEPFDLAALEAKYGARIDGREPVYVYRIDAGGVPIGWIQWYRWRDFPEHAGQLGAEAEAAGVDLAIGEIEYTGRGLGAVILREFAATIVWAAGEVSAVVADPARDNGRSVRAFEKAGYRVVRTVRLAGEDFDRVVVRVDAVAMVTGGHWEDLKRALAARPEWARARPDGQRTLLHVATDWPGHFPNVRETIEVLVAAGADVNARFVGGPHRETPLHWAASSDDVVALDALLDSGADIEADGAVIGGGTALADAVAFRTWAAARRLVERGARTTVWQAAALGLMDGLGEVAPGEVTNAFWNACHGGQMEAARFLLGLGAELNWRGHDGLTPLGAALRSGDVELVDWLKARGAID